MIPSYNDLRYFLEVAHTLNLSRASERLGISQPSLSAAMKRLEQSMDTPLLVRLKTGVQLTKSGQQLCHHAKQMQHMWENIKANCLASSEEVMGQMVIGCHPTVAQYVLTPVLAKLLEQYPRLECRLEHDISRRIVEGVINFKIDIGIVVNPVFHNDLVLKKIYDDEFRFWCTSDYDFNQKAPVLIADIELLQSQKLLKEISKYGWTDYRLIPSTNMEVIGSLAAWGCGIGLLPESVVKNHYQNTLQPIPDLPIFHDEIYLAYRPEQRFLKAQQVFIEAIIQHCSSPN